MSVSPAIQKLAVGLHRDKSPAALERIAVLSRHEVGETIYRFNDPAEHWYRVLVGAARQSALTGDGRRHIVDFILPGDLFGLSVWRARQFCVETIVPGTLIARYPRCDAESVADSNPQVARAIREIAFESIARLQRRMVILGRTSALEKVSAFLLEMADRCEPAPPCSLSLPMSRYDIADYLGMAVETVSRTLTELRACRLIAFGGVRRVRICNRGALEEVVSGFNEPGAPLH